MKIIGLAFFLQNQKTSVKIITLTTDFGSESYYISALKGKLAALLPEVNVMDISDKHHPYDVVEAAYIFNLIQSNFPNGTLHLFLVNMVDAVNGQILLVKNDSFFYLMPDNGSLSMIFDTSPIEVFLYYETAGSSSNDWLVIAEAAAEFIGNNLQTDQSFKKFDGYQQKSPVRPVMNENYLTGTIMFNDSLGNAHTNITENDFRNFTGNQKFRILLSRHEWVEQIQTRHSDTKEGEPFASFNHANYLYIGVKKGKSNQLMNLTKSRPVRIELI